MAFQPTKFGKFLLLDKIATGGMAEIFMAQTVGPGGFEKIVALNRILPNLSSNQEFISMFIDEAKVTSQLTHGNIVQIYEFGEIDQNYYLSMEFVDGKNLRQILARAEEIKRILPLEHVVYIVNKICEGLDYAHRFRDKREREALQIVHRDISPQNILLSYEGEVKLIDFGIAKTRSQDGKTKSGVLKGKFGYMSPEQASGTPIDQRTDIFSTGIILFEMLTHQRLFASNNDLATLKKIQEAKIPAPSLFNPDIPFELEEIVLKALSKDPNKRYQTAHQFHRDLSKFLHTLNPDFTSSHVASFVRSLFALEILEHKKTMIEVAKPPEIEKKVLEVTPEKTKVSEVKESTRTDVQWKADKEKVEEEMPLPQEPYTHKVWLQIGVLGLAVVTLSLLLLFLNQNPTRMIQSEIPQQSKPTPVTQTSVLRIDTDPQNADVHIDEKLFGQTPLAIPHLPQHQELKILLKKAGYQDVEENISLTTPTHNINKILVAIGSGFLNIKTVPNSDIYVDGTKIGTTPILKFEITAGKHTIRAVNTELNLTAEKDINIEVDEVKLVDETELVFHPVP